MKKNVKRLSHEEKVTKCQEFIKHFEDYDMMDVKQPYEQYGRLKYMIKLVISKFYSATNSQRRTKHL